jgi:hypothetical protein
MPYRIFCVLLVIFTGTQLNAQELLEQLALKLTKAYADNAKEQIVLQTDKKIYRAGSDIWFRVFSVSSNGAAVQGKDKVIYVELVNDKDEIVDRVLLNKQELQYNGSIPLSSDLDDGFYHLRVYTKTILQQYPSDMFVGAVYVINEGKKEIKKEKTREPIYKFYVEGDGLVNGVSSLVVFTAADKNGRPVEVSGIVKDNFNNEVAKFSGTGIGRIQFEPYSKDRTYRVYIRSGNSAEQSFTLPAIKIDAFQLSLLNHSKEEFVFRVALGDSVYKKKAVSYLLGVSNGKICYAASGSAMYLINIPVSSLPHGLIDFYLYDQDQQLKSRRTVFNENYLSIINITTDRAEYGSRQKAKMSIEILDKDKKPVQAVLSVSIADKKLVAERILHDADVCLLSRNSSGLNADEFINTSETRDLLAMITNVNAPLLKNTPGIKIPGEVYWDGLEIKGRVADKQNGALADQLIVLMTEEENAALNDSTDYTGAFVFRDMVFYGKKQFHVMLPAVYSKQEKYEIIQEPSVFPLITTYDPAFNNISVQEVTSYQGSFADSSVTGGTRILLHQLSIQEQTGNKKNKTNKKNDILSPRRITADKLDKLGLSNTADAVKMIPGVMMMGGRLTIRGGIMTPMGDLNDIEPLLIIDGVQTRAGSVVDYLNSIPPSNIEYIEVYAGSEASMFGSRGGNGAIVVKTSNQVREKKDDKQRQTIVASGFYKEQTFYQPPYDSYAVRETIFVDNRATIYWNGEVITDSTGKASVSFYTADLKNDYTVTIQGISEKGELIFKTYTLKKR